MNTYLTIGAEKIECTYVPLEVDKISLDPKNPRLATELQIAGGDSSEEKMASLLLEKAQVQSLLRSIEENGGLIEPMIVVPRSEGRYVVYEGNCRLACLKRLAASENGAPFRSAPCVVISDPKFSDLSKAVLLSGIHVTQKIKWTAFDKARLINELLTVHNKSQTWAARHLRINPSVVELYIRAYEHTLRYINDKPTSMKDVQVFDYFFRFFSAPALKERAAKDAFVVAKFDEWIRGGKFPRALDVKLLPVILNSPKGMDEFLRPEGNIRSAVALVQKNNPDATVPILRVSKRLQERFRDLSETDWHRLCAHAAGAEKTLSLLTRSANQLLYRIRAERSDNPKAVAE